MLLYFAYGSNMNVNQMAFHCPDAEPVDTLRLMNYRLAFRDNGSGTGVATILPERGSYVDGILWRISAEDERHLDHYANSYLMSGNYSISSSDLERIESLYFVNIDFILYQNESIISGASCKIDIAYIDGEWKILGMFQNERFSDTLLVAFAKQYYESVNGDVPPNVEVDHYEGDNVVIHLYEMKDNTISTWDWYTINPYTCEGTDFLGNEVLLYEFFDSAGQ